MQALQQGVAERIAAAGGRVDYVEVRASSIPPYIGTHMVWSTLGTRMIWSTTTKAYGFCVLAGGLAAHCDNAYERRVDVVLQVVDADELTPVEALSARPALLAVAAFFGRVRLIDNMLLQGG